MPNQRFLRMSIFGAEETERMLLDGMRAAGNMKPALEYVAEDLMEVIDINFGSQGHRGGGSWAKLSPYTLERKAREGEPPIILVATSALRDSMTLRRDPNMDLRINRNRISLSSRLPYAQVQDEGGGPSHLPARPFAEFLKSDVDRWAKLCSRYLIDRMKLK